MKKLIVANWKMNPETLAQAQEILERVDDWLAGLENRQLISLVFCPPFVFLEEVGQFLEKSHLRHSAEIGAQNIALSSDSAQTGEISSEQLARLKVGYVIIGHSERRWKLGETDKTVNAKIKIALAQNLNPIVCLGERERGASWLTELAQQTQATLDDLTVDEIKKCLFAYEPVWAISSNPGAKADNPEKAIEAITYLRQITDPAVRFLYGGSVTPENCLNFLARPEIDGLLIGQASLKINDFISILRLTLKLTQGHEGN